MNVRKCKVMYGRDHLATLTVLPDGRWELIPTETHLPMHLLHHVKLFDPYIGPVLPPLIQMWEKNNGLRLDPKEPIAFLIMSTSSSDGLKFVPEGR